MQQAVRDDCFKRLNYIEGHLTGVRKMIEEDKYCVDVLKQTYAVRKAIEKLESIILSGHLHGCVPHGIKDGREEQVISELIELYNLSGK